MGEEIRATLIEMIRALPEPLLERVELKFRDLLEEIMEEWKWEEYYWEHKDEFKKILIQAKEELKRGKVSDLSELLEES